MTQHPRTAARTHGATRLALVLAAALLGLSSLRADEPAVPGPPLFEHNRIDGINRHGLVTAVVTNGAIPTTGPYASLGALYAGGHDFVQLWSLEGPLTNLYSRRAVGATSLVLNAAHALPPGPLALAATHAATLHAGASAGCWEWHNPTFLQPFHRDELRVITDGTPLPIGTDETVVYARALIRAHRASAQAFARAAQREVTHNHVRRDPNLYRGAVLHVQGRLKRINRYAPLREVALAGVNDVYEAWVFPDHLGGNPFCVLFTQWPAGLPRELLGQAKIDAPIRVQFDGFFFKNCRYTANDGRNGQREAPLLIGHSLVVLADEGAAAGASPSARWLLFGFAAVLAALILGAVGVTYWYRRIDNRVRRRILATQSPEFIPPAPDAILVAPPIAPSGKKPAGAAGRLPFGPRITFPVRRSDHSGDGGTEDKPPDDASGA